jgi:hypothetical protein
VSGNPQARGGVSLSSPKSQVVDIFVIKIVPLKSSKNLYLKNVIKSKLYEFSNIGNFYYFQDNI